jgi:hypothetical protein
MTTYLYPKCGAEIETFFLRGGGVEGGGGCYDEGKMSCH